MPPVAELLEVRGIDGGTQLTVTQSAVAARPSAPGLPLLDSGTPEDGGGDPALLDGAGGSPIDAYLPALAVDHQAPPAHRHQNLYLSVAYRLRGAP